MSNATSSDGVSYNKMWNSILEGDKVCSTAQKLPKEILTQLLSHQFIPCGTNEERKKDWRNLFLFRIQLNSTPMRKVCHIIKIYTSFQFGEPNIYPNCISRRDNEILGGILGFDEKANPTVDASAPGHFILFLEWCGVGKTHPPKNKINQSCLCRPNS